MDAAPLSATRYFQAIRDGNPDALALYERHYSARRYRDGRKRRCFVGPGERIVLMTPQKNALFAWRKQLFTKNGQMGICCCVFRNESDTQSSRLIREAMGIAGERWPGERLFTYVNPRKVRSANPGCCFKAAGWHRCGTTKGGLAILEFLPGMTINGQDFGRG